MVTFPNGKINIGLNILRKRADGYHDLETVMLPVGLTDVLEIVKARQAVQSDSLTVSGRPVACRPEQNLVMKAVTALRNVADFPAVDIFLHKVIPDGAGLGGGSADAAFTLRCVRDMFGLKLTDADLCRVAATLGADCPFFIYNRPMLCTGTGTTLSPIDVDLANYYVALVKPCVSVSTAEAYAGAVPQDVSGLLANTVEHTQLSNWRGVVVNQFERTVFAAYPEIAAVKKKLYAMGAAYASMSGSGSAVYGLFDYEVDADNLADEFPLCDCFTSRLS